MTELKLPALGEGIEEGTVISILVKVGDTISMEQSLIEVETDKVVVEVPANKAGIVTEILVNLGDVIGEGIAILKVSGGIEEELEDLNVAAKEIDSSSVLTLVKDQASDKKVIEKARVKKGEHIELKLPSLGEGIENGTVIAIHVAEGDTIVIEQTLMEIETDKVVVEVPAEIDGEVIKLLVDVGDEVGEATPIFKILATVSEAPKAKKDQLTKQEIVAEIPQIIKQEIPANSETQMSDSLYSARKRKFRASPLAKKIAREIGIDISAIPPKTGRNRISVKDVKNYAKELNQNRASGVNNSQLATLPDLSKWGTIRSEAMSGIMQATSKNMTTSWGNIPHAWLQEKVDITYLEEKRQAHKAAFKAKGSSLTITSILVKVIANALKDFPIFNASIDTRNAAIVYKDYINVGVAVDTDRGLLVPVLKNADQKSITDISYELNTLAQKVKSKKIAAEELAGTTFTISNLGGIGTSAIFPLVSFPQVAILGVAGSQTEAKYIEGQFQPRLIMPLTIGFDHRIINGADAARFLKHVKSLLEDWFNWNL